VSSVTVPSRGRGQLVGVVFNPDQEDIMPDNRDWANEPKDKNLAEDKDLATEGAKDRLKGAGKELEGRVRSTVGAAKGDSTEQVKGKAQEVKGKIQQGIGKAKQRLDRDPGVEEED
jgi:uncharacterized protein YjbJ (UPF0337 family)